jgi:signal transduction histidine kinase
MRLLPKLLLPLLAVLVTIMGYFYGVWMPGLYAEARQEHGRETARHLDSVAEGLVPLILGNQLDVIYENLDALKKANPEWKIVTLADGRGRTLYPLNGESSGPVQSDPDVMEIHKTLRLNDEILGEFTLLLDQGPAIAQQRQHLFKLGIVFASLCFVLMIAMFLLVKTMILDPVLELARASKALARRDFETPLPTSKKDEIGTLIEAFANMREARRKAEENLARSNKELEQFAYAASHDLREPLRMVGSYVSLIERRYSNVLDKDGLEFIAYAKDGANRMDRMIQDLLEYSRVGRKFEEKKPLSLAETAKEAQQMLSVRIKDLSAVIEESEGFRQLPLVPGHHAELMRLFMNLLSNAVKYHAPDTKPLVAIDGRADKDMVTVSIKDNGIGIEEKFFERIFQIFQRLHSRDEFEGSGIGLATCKKIVEHHNGKIWVESVPGQGSTFSFSLPREG